MRIKENANLYSFSLLFCFAFMFTNLSLGSVFLADILTIVAVFLIFITDKLKFNFSDNDKIFYLFFMMFISYSAFIMIYHGADYFSEVLRNFRVPLYYYVVKTLFFRYRERLSSVFITIVVFHSLIVVAGAFNQQFFEIMASLINYEKLWWLGRGNGLTTSFDTAGFLILIAIILLSDNITKLKSLLAFSLLIMGFFTGRTFMVLGPIAFLLYHFAFQRRFYYILMFSIIAFLFVLVLEQFLPFYNIAIDIVGSVGQGDGYYNTTGRLLEWGGQIANYMTFLGVGGDLIGIDLGYLKTLYYGGAIYFLFQLVFVVLFPLSLIRDDNYLRILSLLLIFLIYNIKVYSFFASIFMPAFFLALFTLAKTKKELGDGCRCN